MKCPHPLLIKNPNFEQQIKDNVKANPYFSVPCGKCAICRRNEALSWRIRLLEEFSVCSNCFFITLTYSDEKRPVSTGTDFNGNTFVYHPVVKSDVQKFLKRFRVYFERKRKTKLERFKYFLVSEYTPEHLFPHYHALFFNIDGIDPRSQVSLAQLRKEVAEIWDNGFIKLDVTTFGRIVYVSDYINGFQDLPFGYQKPFRLMSKRPAIGYNYLERADTYKWHKRNLNGYYQSGTYKMRLPKYYYDNLFSDEEKEIISGESQDRALEEALNLPIDLIREYSISNSERLDHMRIDYLKHRWKKMESEIEKKYKKSRKL